MPTKNITFRHKVHKFRMRISVKNFSVIQYCTIVLHLLSFDTYLCINKSNCMNLGDVTASKMIVINLLIIQRNSTLFRKPLDGF